MPLSPERVILGHRAALALVRERVLTFARTAWRSSANYRDADVARLVALITPRVQAGQLQTANLTSAYIASIATIRTGALVKPTLVDRGAILDARGVPVTEEYRRPAIAVYSSLADGKPFPDAVKVGLEVLGVLIATDMQMANVRQARESYRSQGVTLYVRIPSGGKTCGLCIDASGKSYHTDNLMPIHPGCVPGGSVVRVPSGHGANPGAFAWGEIQAVTRRHYSGELVIIRTAAGDQVSVTPNHPVLTDKGWVPANLVREGDDVFRSSGRHGVIDGGPDEDHRPALIEDVWRAACVSGRLVTVPLASEDFHGDGSDGEVDVVYPNSDFAPVGGVTLGEPNRELPLVAGHGGRFALDGQGSLGSLVPSGLTAGRGDVRGSGLGLALCERHLRSTELLGGSVAARFDAPAEEFSLENVSVYASQGLNLKRRLGSEVEADRVVESSLVSFSGHVFNLQTREGWYSSNSHIVSNCACSTDVSPAGTPPISEMSDQVAIRDHGEIGPMLTNADYAFAGPGDIAT